MAIWDANAAYLMLMQSPKYAVRQAPRGVLATITGVTITGHVMTGIANTGVISIGVAITGRSEPRLAHDPRETAETAESGRDSFMTRGKQPRRAKTRS